MSSSKKISVLLYSYKNKSLKNVVLNILENAINDIRIFVFDQNPIDRSAQFKDMPFVIYENKPWYDINGKTIYFKNKVKENWYDVLFIMSDNIKLSTCWDELCINIINKNGPNTIISGSGNTSIIQKDKFSFSIISEHSPATAHSNIIDHDFIGAGPEIWQSGLYPSNLKFYGISELATINAIKNNFNIISMPSQFYQKISDRQISESIYVPFSLWHNYNYVINKIKDGSQESNIFIEKNKINTESLFRLPYDMNDVSYDPNSLEIISDKSIRYHAGLGAIY